MKRLLAILIILCVPCLGAVNYVSSNTSSASFTSTATPSVSFTSVTAGSTLLIGFRNGSNETATCSVDNAGWTTVEGPLDHASTTMRAYVFMLENAASGDHNVTLTCSSAIAGHISKIELTGVPTSSVLDGTPTTVNTSSSGSAGPYLTASITPTQAGATLGFYFNGATVSINTLNSGETNATNTASTRAHITFKTHASGGTGITHSVTFSGSGHMENIAIAVKESRGSPPATAARRRVISD